MHLMDYSSSLRRSERNLPEPEVKDATSVGRFVFMKDEIYDRQNNIIHSIVATESSRLKHCVFCQIYKVKTKSGWRVSTRTKCNICDVPLCKMNRDCFRMYHKLMEGGLLHTVMKRRTRDSSGPTTVERKPVKEYMYEECLDTSQEHDEKYDPPESPNPGSSQL
ncbi:hypothetical protein FSP39_024499 [Pinctada imbricata]|uniref:PiggyBac transposable element-derived protein 4 C-terminal zinc-finger domain-containing protein n=1 Tax=Pinctada imbricata TaxID=66713 RepID=A0AA88YRL0_PINIB|nr:hypothetical protein FSP39_024499 [Pinctada imbricata]